MTITHLGCQWREQQRQSAPGRPPSTTMARGSIGASSPIGSTGAFSPIGSTSFDNDGGADDDDTTSNRGARNGGAGDGGCRGARPDDRGGEGDGCWGGAGDGCRFGDNGQRCSAAAGRDAARRRRCGGRRRRCGTATGGDAARRRVEMRRGGDVAALVLALERARRADWLGARREDWLVRLDESKGISVITEKKQYKRYIDDGLWTAMVNRRR